MTPFGEIIKRAVLATPDAVGGAFADGDGEMVDSFASNYQAHDWAMLTAHYGVILSHLHATFGLWHFGGPECFVARHHELDIVVHAIDGGYYALLAIRRAPATAASADDVAQHALAALATAAKDLFKEMS